MSIEKMKRNSYISILIGACLWESCQNNQMYFDEPTQCLVSADGYDLRWVYVDNDTQNMSYLIYRKGRHKSTLNLHKIKYVELFYTKNDSLVPQHLLHYVYAPNCHYEVINATEGDATPCRIFLATDSVGHFREIQNENIE